MVEKKNSIDMHRVTHLSYLKVSSINTSFDSLDAENHYQTFEAAVNLMVKAGHGSFVAKEDLSQPFIIYPWLSLNLTC